MTSPERQASAFSSWLDSPGGERVWAWCEEVVGRIVPGLSALVIVWTALQQRRALAIVGALLLVGSFAVAATGKPGTLYLDYFNSTQALHYLLAAGIALLALPRLSAQADASAPPA
ncbi:hypothetical protein RFI20_005310 [Klebsiella pneumoniae]|uniref:hypothetical protein n=1 Tax=Enterobacteriaceae TaxID=543 RepID=UPI000DF0D060|nr:MULTISPECIES: hypothetical protein [Enterobacteriaceae]ELY2789852.1 hypothetical protein [Cronobacter sakazakii]HDG8064621.1 hypothetical protein [Klebsiella quasipneumoniae subsp. similipneumoniae]HED2998837.1 hypothetical protein [Citrobacter freundii]ELA2592788.1 hypothetical protein [Klebsiella pneumoniae]MCB4612065.1 hypothetical protein [Enterobacter asburiae]